MPSAAFLPPFPLLSPPFSRPRPRVSRPCTVARTGPPAAPLSRAASAALAAALLLVPLPVRAARARSALRMTDQVPNFTLPSQDAAAGEGEQGGTRLGVAIRVARRVAPPVAVVVVAAWGVRSLVRRARARQLRDFQTQLASFSSMLDRDVGKEGEGGGIDAAEMARRVMEGSTKRYKFRGDGEGGGGGGGVDEDIAGKVRLDLFRAAGTSGIAGEEGKAGKLREEAEVVVVGEAAPEGEYEASVAECLGQAELGDAAARTAAAEALADARVAAGLSEAEAKRAFDGYLSRVVSVQIDRAAGHLESDDRESLKQLHQLSVTMSAAKALGPEAVLTYVGTRAEGEKTKEELYRRYAVFCLSSEERAKDDLDILVDMQTLLKVSDARAETINTEIAKGMFQVAVSAAMADGSLDDKSREALEKLKESFGDLLDGGSADSIMSEVAVMRAMYSLQQLLQEQGVSDDDVKELRNMCQELGVDIDEMLQHADALGDALGPEAKEFVESLRSLLRKSAGAGSADMVTTTVKPVEPTKDGAGAGNSS